MSNATQESDKAKRTHFKSEVDGEKLNFDESLSIKALFNIASYIIIGFTIQPGNGFFVSLLIFVFALGYDLFKYSPYKKYRKNIRTFQRIFTIHVILLCFSGMAGVLSIDKSSGSNTLFLKLSQNNLINTDFKISMFTIWFIIAIGFIMPSIIEFGSSVNNFEKKILKDTSGLKVGDSDDA